MKPEELIENYVDDVVRRLPRKQRRDVGFELRELLADELRGRSEASGGEPDAQLALQLLSDFGRPADVADRYRPAGFTIIKPADAPQFARVALIGVGVQWVLTLTALFATPADVSWLSRLGTWWVSWGLGAFWWPGLLITLSIIAAAVSSQRDAREPAPPRIGELDRDWVRRPVVALYIALGVIGATIVLSLPTLGIWGSGLPQPLINVFEFDEGFLTWRAPWVVLLWAATLGVGVHLLVKGRWTAVSRRVSLVISVAWIILLVVWVFAGPIFVPPATESATKFCLAALLVVFVVDLALTIRRSTRHRSAPVVAGKHGH